MFWDYARREILCGKLFYWSADRKVILTVDRRLQEQNGFGSVHKAPRSRNDLSCRLRAANWQQWWVAFLGNCRVVSLFNVFEPPGLLPPENTTQRPSISKWAPWIAMLSSSPNYGHDGNKLWRICRSRPHSMTKNKKRLFHFFVFRFVSSQYLTAVIKKRLFLVFTFNFSLSLSSPPSLDE